MNLASGPLFVPGEKDGEGPIAFDPPPWPGPFFEFAKSVISAGVRSFVNHDDVPFAYEILRETL